MMRRTHTYRQKIWLNSVISLCFIVAGIEAFRSVAPLRWLWPILVAVQIGQTVHLVWIASRKKLWDQPWYGTDERTAINTQKAGWWSFLIVSILMFLGFLYLVGCTGSVDAMKPAEVLGVIFGVGVLAFIGIRGWLNR